MPQGLSKTDLMYEITYNPSFVPSRSPKVNIMTAIIDDEKKYFMRNHETGNLYFLTEFGNDLWNIIDGKRTVKEIYEAMDGIYKDLRRDLVTESLIYYAEEGALEAVLEPVKKKRLFIASAFMVRLTLVWESNKFFQSIHRLVRPLLRKPLLWVAVSFVTVMGLLFAGRFVSIFTNKENFEIMGSTVVGFFFYYFAVLAPIIAVHEIAHGLTLFHYGGIPKEIGTGLYYFGPMFYIDVTDGWTLDRYHRIMVFAAGPLSTITIGSLIMAVQYLWQFPASISLILTMATFYCFYGLLIDLSPLLETDGYHILCDVVNIPDLRKKSFTYIKNAARRLIKQPIKDEDEKLTIKTKAILLTYAALAAIWAVYLVFRSLLIVIYMAEDTAISVLNVFSAFIGREPTMIMSIVLAIASVLYFGMVMSGYGLALFVSVKKAMARTFRFEAIHDRDVSVFLYLPEHVPQLLFTRLKQQLTGAAKNFTNNFSIRQIGSMCVVVLRMSSTKLALVQIKEHFRNIESKFSAVYQRFLKSHKTEILESGWRDGSQMTSLAELLSEMGKQATRAGTPEANDVIAQVIDRQKKAALYLLNSVYGQVWTIELPPTLLLEMGKALLPTLLVEDLSITDLYDEVEDFKKRTICGFDSLAKFSSENQESLQEALLHPEKYHVICSFEPIKNRLVFVGRTEQIEKALDSFGGLFVCQAWCGYLDNLLSEVNLSLYALSKSPLPTTKSIRSMKDGELATLDRDISSLITHRKSLTKSLRNSNRHLKYANLELEELRSSLRPTSDFKIGLLDPALQMNTENLAHLPSQFESFRTLSQELYFKIRKIQKTVKGEIEKRKELVAGRKRRKLAIFPFLIALSVILAFVGLQMFGGYMTILFLTGALSVQLLYGTAYLSFLRSLNRVGKYPSLAFHQVLFLTFAFTEALYKFMSTANVLNPTKTASDNP